jgi:hypothetical protein
VANRYAKVVCSVPNAHGTGHGVPFA